MHLLAQGLEHRAAVHWSHDCCLNVQAEVACVLLVQMQIPWSFPCDLSDDTEPCAVGRKSHSTTDSRSIGGKGPPK